MSRPKSTNASPAILLIEAGANPRRPGRDGRSALKSAEAIGHKRMLALFQGR